MAEKRKNPEDLISLKSLGRTLEVIALALLIYNFVLWNMEDKDLRTIGIILLIANILLFTGLILSHLPQELRKGDEKMSSKHQIFYKIIILLLLVLCAVATFWGTFFITLDIINAIPIYGLSLCIPAIFSAFITSLVLIYLKNRWGERSDQRNG